MRDEERAAPTVAENKIPERKVPIPDGMWRAVKAHASLQDVPMGRIVRRALKEWLDKHPLMGATMEIEATDGFPAGTLTPSGANGANGAGR